MMLTPKAREVLDMLDDVLAHESSETAHGVWTVLTALRGPDSGHEEVKLSSTVLIRIAAFPKTAEVHRYNPCLAQFDNAEPFRDPEAESPHFRNHVICAAGALGIPISSEI